MARALHKIADYCNSFLLIVSVLVYETRIFRATYQQSRNRNMRRELLSDDHDAFNSAISTSKQIKCTEKNMIAGGVAGVFSKTIMAPLSRLTILYQVGPLLTERTVNFANYSRVKDGFGDSLYSSIRSIIKTEGVLALWKGNLTSIIHRFPYSAINFASFEYSQGKVLEYLKEKDNNASLVRFFAGAISGAVSCVSCYPLELVRTRVTVGLIDNSSPNVDRKILKIPGTIVRSLLSILKTEGFTGLYSGLYASLLVAVPTFAVSFAVYGKMKDILYHRGFAGKSVGHLSPFGSLLSGSISGVASSLLIFPLDVIRKRMQISGGLVAPLNSKNAVNRNHDSILKHARIIIMQDGVKGFYRGILPELLKVCPMVALTFCSFELAKETLDIYI